MKEPRRWLEDTSPETLELRRLLAAAETPRPMHSNERLQAAERVEAMETRASLPVHRFFPDFSFVTQWWSSSSDSHRPLGRAKRRARMFVLVGAVLLVAALAGAAPQAARWWASRVAHDVVEGEANTLRERVSTSPSIVIPEKPRDSVAVVPEPLSSALLPTASAPVLAPEPMGAKTRPSANDVPNTQAKDLHNEPAELPSASPATASSQIQDRQSRLKAELALLGEAQALVGTNPSAALALLARHEREFPAAMTSVDRELLYIEALRKLGRLSEARARAKGNLEWARGRSNEGKWQQVVDSLQ